MTYPLDHTGQMRADLDAGAAALERLGFLLSPETPQQGAVPGEDGMRPWATANRCALFHREGYLELIGIRAPDRFNPWTRISWPGTRASTSRPSAALARTRRGRAWRRRGSPRRCSAPARRRPEKCASATSSPRTQAGPRGASSSSSTRRRRCCGGRNCWSIRTAPARSGNACSSPTGRADLSVRLAAFGADLAGCAVLSAEACADLFPGEAAPAPPCMAGHVIAFADLDRAIRLMEGNGVPVGRDRLGRAFVGRRPQ